MAEQTVQVPVSLAQRFLEVNDAGLAAATIDRDELRAIIAGPTKEETQRRILEASALQLASEERAVGYLPFDKHSEFPVEEHAYPSPLWCHNDAPHEAHRERNEYGDWNECTGRPIPEETS